MITLGWKAGPEQYPPDHLLESAVAAEKAGFDALEASDHFAPWTPEGQAAFIWTWLGAAAVKTEKIRMGTGVTCPILRYHPTIIAQAVATLAVISRGRAFLGVGTGEALNEYAAIGNWPDYETRQAMLKEAIELIRELLCGDEVTFQGDYYETKKARIYTLPEHYVPIYVSSMVPDSAEFAGTYGDGLISVGGKEPEVYKQIIQEFEKGASSAGKDPAKMPKLIELNVAYTQDTDAAVEGVLKYWAGTFIPALFKERIYTPKDSAENGQPVGKEAVMKKACISAKPEDHIKNARKYLDLGFNQLYFHTAGPDEKAFLEGYGRDVLPALRQEVKVKG